jgi:ribosomal protein L11 methyltransferase
MNSSFGYWSTTFYKTTALEPSELGGVCAAFGAEGTHENQDGSITAFFNCSEKEAIESIEAVKYALLPLVVQESALTWIVQENWVQRHQEVLEPIECAPWKIVQFSEVPATLPMLDEYQLAVIPGMGFGTGHHPSTQLALKLIANLKSSINRNNTPKNILDIGTGSAILTVACEKLWHHSNGFATDTDEQALINAQDVLQLNGSKNITLSKGSFPTGSTVFNLITANLYAECLVSLVDEITERSAPNCFLILSGILKERSHLVEEAFGSRWHKQIQLEEQEWCASMWQFVKVSS